MKTDIKKTLCECLFGKFKESGSDIADVFNGLFKIAEKDGDLESTLKFTYDCWSGNTDLKEQEWYKAEWFYVFHKSIRQCDFYNNCKITLRKSELSPAKDKRRRELHALNTKQRKAYGFDDVDFGGYEYYELKKKYNEEHKDLLREIYDLDEKYHKTEDTAINGYLGSILWSMIHVDTKGYLSEAMEEAFEEYQMYQNTKRCRKPRTERDDVNLLPAIVVFTCDIHLKIVPYIVADKLGQRQSAPIGSEVFCVGEAEYGEKECLRLAEEDDNCTACMEIYMKPKEVPDWVMKGYEDGAINFENKFIYDRTNKTLNKY